ncbi:NAD-dependent protein deacylase [Fervidicoccus fontis]|uniref:NAD-dependent protein deacylase n=1 Tax=Fervidicoccus fontis TaxID=683846 RepID=A0A843A7T8_9CREN|nr:NAD-dependent protein deacylase [Fervidicoccus fontis]MBE9390755.1 NAD-dependent protein deacylase [Fervidicoccus fontis]
MSAEEKLAKTLIDAGGKALFFTGAGASTESGVPDFRGPQGLWKRIPPEVFDIDLFYRDPEYSWRIYAEYVYSQISRASPNRAHIAIAELESLGLVEAVITQNIDKLHQKAGSKKVIELHGTYDKVQCLRCGFHGDIKDFIEDFIREKRVPRCPKCGRILKPAVVYFGEPLPSEELSSAFSLAKSSKLIIVVGSSLSVYPAALIPEIALDHGAKLFIINESPTHLDKDAELVVREKAGTFLEKVSNAVEEMMKSSKQKDESLQ